MLKKLIAAMLLLFVVTIAFAQTGKPDLKKIEKDIKDNNSPFFYSTLMKRCTDNDTTLSVEDYRYLYYGYALQKNYSPYGKPAVHDDIKKARTAGDMEEVIDLQKKAVKEYPFNLRSLFDLANLLEKRDSVQSAIYYTKLATIVKAIMSTGDGTENAAYYVISVDHEYDLISLLGFEYGGMQSLKQGKDGPMDKMKLKKNDDNIEYLYFNVSILFSSMEKMFKN